MNAKTLRVFSNVIMVIPIIKILWLMFYYIGFESNIYLLIGHSVEYDLLLLAFSFLFRHCLWHKILIVGCLSSLLFEFLQNKGLFLSITFFNFAAFLLGVLLISTVTFFINGRQFKKKASSSSKSTDKKH